MNPELQRIIELGEQLGLSKDPHFLARLRRLMFRPNPAAQRALLRQLLHKAGNDAFYPPPFRRPSAEELALPDVPGIGFGHAVNIGSELQPASRFSFPFISRHYLITGRARSGKTRAVCNLIRALPNSLPVWLLDPDDDPTYGQLVAGFPAEDFLVVNISDFRRNPLEPPPGCPTGEWFSQFKRNAREALFLRDGSTALLTTVLERCVRERGQFIALRDVYEVLTGLRFKLGHGREQEYFQTLKNRLESLILNPIFACRRGHDLRYLATKKVLFRCASLGPDDFALIANDLLLWLATYFRPSVNPEPMLAVVLEEVHRLTNWQRLRRADLTEAVICEAARLLSKRRIMVLHVDQVPSELPIQIVANAPFRCIFSLVEGRDLDFMQRSLSLSHEQREFISRLPQRACVVQCDHFPGAFPVVVDEFDVADDAAVEEEIRARREDTLSRLEHEPLEERACEIAKPAAAQVSQSSVTSGPSLDAIEYLIAASRNQFLPVSFRDRDLGKPLGEGNALRGELVKAGLVTIERVNTHSRSRWVENTKITDKGYEFLKTLKVAVERPRGRGGWSHQFHQNSVFEWARRNGYDARIECAENPDGKAVDVHLEKDGKRIGVEIYCEGLAKEINNVRDLHSHDVIWFGIRTTDDARKLQELIGSVFTSEAWAILGQIEFKLLGKFYDELRDARAAQAAAS